MTRGLGLAVGAALVATAGMATSLAGCLEDLHEPLSCPAPAVVEGSAQGCFEEIALAYDAGQIDLTSSELCLVADPMLTACYRGPGGCTCDTEAKRDCVPTGDDEACFPSGDCPAKVREQFPSARCVTLLPDDIGPNAREPEQCLCGCEHCMSVCDGRGPVWSQIELVDGDVYQDPKGFLWFDIRRHMPAKGKLGVYLRARGAVGPINQDTGPSFVGVVQSEGQPDPAAIWPLPFDLDDRFEEVLLPPAGEEVYSWSNADTKPGVMVVAAGRNTLTFMEIDCVVPFVIE